MSSTTVPSMSNAPAETLVAAHAPTQIEGMVRAEQVRMVIERSAASNLFNLPVGGLLCWLLWGHVSSTLLLVWLTLKLLACVARGVVTWLHARAPAGQTARWRRRFDLALAFDGAVWGAACLFLLPAGQEVLEMVLLATAIAVAAMGLVILSLSFSSVVAFTLPILLPTALGQLGRGDPVSLYMAVGVLFLQVLVLYEARRACRHTRAMLRLRFRMDDVTARLRLALGQAEQSNLAKSRFLATMSHEMRTPLHAILGLTRLLRQSQPPQDELVRQHQLATLEDAGGHLLGIINDVLDHSRIDAGELALNWSPCHPGELLDSVRCMTAQQAADKGLRLRILNVLPRGQWVVTDASRLRQILLNLLGNAIKFTERGEVVLMASRVQDKLLIDVEDTGPGVPGDQRERIFEAFHQADGSFGRRHEGTGLGLTIARQLALAMGGELVCLSGTRGGALMRLTLPWREAPAPAPQPPRAVPCRFQGQVLVVEDNPVNALVARGMLSRLGVAVTVVEQGEAALQAVREQAELGQGFDLVLMDWHLPGIDGFQATQRLRQWEQSQGLARLPIVALTANALTGDAQRSLAAGMDDHLSKPFDEAALRGVLARYLQPAPCREPDTSAHTPAPVPT